MDKYIKKLLATDFRVIIPEFGAIQALKDEPNVLSFNKFLNFDDGSLTKIISDSEGISQEEAKARVSEFATQMNDIVNRGETAEIEGVGTFAKDEFGALEFKANPLYAPMDPNVSVGSESGTTTEETGEGSPVGVVGGETTDGGESKGEATEGTESKVDGGATSTEGENGEKTDGEGTKEEKGDTVYEYGEEKKSNKGLLIILIILLLLLGIGLTLFVFNKDNAVYRLFFGPKTEQVDEAAKAKAEAAKAKAEAEAKAKAEAEAKAREEAEAAARAEAEKNANNPKVARPLEKRYNVIVGSYKDENVAIKRVEDLQSKGFDGAFVGIRKNYFVAVIGAFSSITQAEAMQEEIVDGKYHIESWITNSGENEKR